MSTYKIFFGATSDLAKHLIASIDSSSQHFILHAKNKQKLMQLNDSLQSKDNNILLDCDLVKLDHIKWQQWSDLFANNDIKINAWYWCVGLQKKLTPLMHYQMHTFFEEIHVNLISATALFKLCIPFMLANSKLILIYKDKAQALSAGHSIAAGGISRLAQIINLEHPDLKVIEIPIDKMDSKFMQKQYPALSKTPKDWLSPQKIADNIEQIIKIDT